MTREESIIRARRAARGYGQQEGKRSFAGVLTTQVLICIILFGGVMSTILPILQTVILSLREIK